MKKLILLFTMFFAAFYINGQNVAINNDGTIAAGSAMLDVKSTTKGFMMPRVSSAQRTAIASPVLGLLVFDTDTKTIWAYNGSSWSNLSSAGGGGFTLPYENSVAVASSAFKLTNSGNAIEGITSGVSSSGIRGIATSNGSNGVLGLGTAANGVGVRGESNTGTGIIGYSTSGTGLSASSISGTGISANSISGLALNINGNFKIAGGNTNPSAGAVLTSDAQGNAVWKANRIAFRGFDVNSSQINLANSTAKKIYFAFENYDYNGNFTPYELSGPPPANASTFSVSVNGVYHLEAFTTLHFTDDYEPQTLISLVLERAGNTTFLTTTFGIKSYHQYPEISDATYFDMKASGDFLLFTGDKIYVEIYHRNTGGASATILGGYKTFFTGHLVFAD